MYLAPFERRQDRAPAHIFPWHICHGDGYLSAVEEGLPAVAHLPLQFVWGLNDFAFTERELKRFQAIFSDHRTLLLPGAGHFVQEDGPAEICAAIRAFAG